MRYALALLIALTASPVAAQVACGARDSVIRNLGEKYGEVRRGGGLTGSTAIFEIWASDTGSWTILKTTPNGMASSTARVVDIEEVEGAVPGHHVVEVTFETHPGDGHSYRAKKEFIDDLSRFRKRERLKVFYDPRDPSEIRLI